MDLPQNKHENLIICQIFHPLKMFLHQSLYNFPFVHCTILVWMLLVTKSVQLIQQVPSQGSSSGRVWGL